MGGGGWEGVMEGDGTMRMVKMDGKVKGNLGFMIPICTGTFRSSGESEF